MSAVSNRDVPRWQPCHQGGFTLIEMMIAAAIIAILAAIAYPNYQHHVQQAHVTDGQAKLLELAGRLERCYTRGDGYRGCIDLPMVSDAGHYDIAGEITVTHYELTATRRGNRVPTECGTLTIRQTGAMSPAVCW